MAFAKIHILVPANQILLGGHHRPWLISAATATSFGPVKRRGLHEDCGIADALVCKDRRH
jgi:hypothetical protein